MLPSILLILLLASCAVTALVFLSALRWGQDRRKLVRLLGALVLVLAVWLGGRALLPLAGLWWRQWVETVLFLASAVLLLSCVACTLRQYLDWPRAKGLYALAGVLSALVLALCVVGFGFLKMIVSDFADRVGEYQGQKVVEESSGFFHYTGYRYVNWFVHGEKVYEWQD